MRVSLANCGVAQPSVGTNSNHFYPGLIEDLEYKQEHILDAALFVPPFPHLYHKCLPLREIMELDQGVPWHNDGGRGARVTWNPGHRWAHVASPWSLTAKALFSGLEATESIKAIPPQFSGTHIPATSPEDLPRLYVNGATILSWLQKLLKWNRRLCIFLNTSITKRQSLKKGTV